MPPELKPLALVTGGARRVGRSIALELAAAGCDVVITYDRSTADAARTVDALAAAGAAAEAVRMPLSDLDSVAAQARELADSRPRWDILVLNASQYAPSPLATLRPQAVLSDYIVNAASPLLLAAAFAGQLSRSRLPHGGSIVAMSDIHALGRPRRDFASYSMSKAALSEMVRSLARDLAPRVRVNAIAPGVVAWPEDGEESNAEAQAAYLRRVPLARAGTPADAARAVRWLALDAGYVTGQILPVDGGRSLT